MAKNINAIYQKHQKNMPSICTFDPIKTALDTNTLLAGATLLALSGLLWYLLKAQPSYENRSRMRAAATLVFFGWLVALGVFGFNAYYASRIKTITIFEDSIDTPEGKILFSDIQNAQIQDAQEAKRFSMELKEKRNQMLLIETTNNKVILLSQENYPIDKVFECLQKAVK
jgi:hypothetical protein